MMEVDLGTRPRDERALAAPGEQYYRELATIHAQAYRRMLDRVFWHPPGDVLRFELRAVPSGAGTQYTVTAILDALARSGSTTIPSRLVGIPSRRTKCPGRSRNFKARFTARKL
ncbi:hypothetical protein LJR296_007267 [Cupriavidus necator]|uniref:hypothetical protein n=1 Tax=Cupriavidus necator TaxID=106590 RepID=UPI003ECE4DF2